MMHSDIAFYDTKLDKQTADERRRVLFPYDDTRHDFIEVAGQRVLSWGKDNLFPWHAAETVRNTTVLNTGLRFLRNLTMGQGIFACKVKGYNDKGDEILQPVEDSSYQRFVGSRMVRRYMEKTLRDFLKVGISAVQFVPNAAGNKIVGLNTINSLHFRFTEPLDALGSQNCVVSGSWNLSPSSYAILPLLSDYSPENHAELLRFMGKMKGGFVYPVRDSWSNDDIYGEPIWWPAYVAGWVDIAHMVPQYLKKAYKNQTTWKWHVQIPYSFWDKKFPMTEFKDVDLRRQAIDKYMSSIEKNLLGAENAEKPIFTNYAVNEMNGRIEEEWKILPLSNKYSAGQENLVTSAAANSEILFALMVNPNVLGAGMPGGSYAGNQGGSNIREAFLVNIANSWIDRQNILDPLQLYMQLNGADEDVQLRFRNTILTTLDTGAGTTHQLS